MEQSGRQPGTVKSTVKTFQILEALRDTSDSTVTELSESLGFAKSTVHRHLSTLEEMNYVVKSNSEYRIGTNFLRLGQATRISKPGRVAAKERTIELAQETDERSLFLVEEESEGVYLYRAGGQGPYRTEIMVGQRRPLHTLASGKSILAQWSDERIVQYVDTSGLESSTENTITDREALLDELAQIRSNGYSFNDEEHRLGLRAVAVPVFGENEEVIGAFSVFGPKGRLKGSWYREELPTILRDKADEMRIDLAYE